MNMTDDIERIEWVSPLGGHWRRDFRLAEWLPGPVSHSCETWLLPALDRGFSDASRAEYGSGTKPGVLVVNGWGFATDPMPTNPVRLLTTAPVRMVRIAAAMARMATRPEAVERWVAEPGLARYLAVDLPALRSLVLDAEERADAASPAELVSIVDGLAVGTGRLMLGMVQAMGFAAKVEYATARLFADHLEGKVDARPQDLFIGHTDPTPTADHAVTTLDWCEPTAGERGTTVGPDPSVVARLRVRRDGAQSACRSAIGDDSAVLARFDRLMTMLARWAPVREQLAADFTLAWPVMRRAMLRLGSVLVDRGAITTATDVFALSRAEIEAAAATSQPTPDRPLDVAVADRWSRYRAQRDLVPPLSIGKPVRQWKHVESISGLYRTAPPVGARVIVTGLGTSPGRVTGIARIVRGPDDFDEVRTGEIVVAPSTAPAWTPLFAIAAGVVTDAGGPFAHTSIVAREFGIPAIVTATGATQLIRSGDEITLDAASGTVTAS